MPRFALLAGFAVALALIPQASGVSSGALVPGAPTGLRAFLLRADEPILHEFSRTPSYSWSPVAEHGGRYQFELASSRTFQDSTLVFKDDNVPFPAETISRQLPWVTGDPYALWAHVRWISSDSQRATPWSVPFGINMQWPTVPTQLPAPEGLIRWTPVDGATSYEVLYTDFVPAVSFQTTTNVADERELLRRSTPRSDTARFTGGSVPCAIWARAVRQTGCRPSAMGPEPERDGDREQPSNAECRGGA